MTEISTKPYLLRALYEWCTDHGYTPYMAVMVDEHTQVPMQFVKDGEIVLNISFEATDGLQMKNDAVWFRARFHGVARDVYVPVGNVIALYAKENGHGMAFEATPLETPVSSDMDALEEVASPPSLSVVTPPISLISTREDMLSDTQGVVTTPPKKNGPPTLTIIK